MRVSQYCENVPSLDTLRDTDIYRMCFALWENGHRPNRSETAYIKSHIAHGTTGVLLRGWLFDFAPLLSDEPQQLTIAL
jgi:hypothetical protein